MEQNKIQGIQSCIREINDGMRLISGSDQRVALANAYTEVSRVAGIGGSKTFLGKLGIGKDEDDGLLNLMQPSQSEKDTKSVGSEDSGDSPQKQDPYGYQQETPIKQRGRATNARKPTSNFFGNQ